MKQLIDRLREIKNGIIRYETDLEEIAWKEHAKVYDFFFYVTLGDVHFLLDHIEKLEVALRKCEQNAGDVNMIGAIVEDAFEKKEWVTE